MPSPLTVKRNDYHKNPKRSDIETPIGVCNFIASLFPDVESVFDPCVGTGNLVKAFLDRDRIHVRCVDTVDIMENHAIRPYILDFLTMTIPIVEDLVVCNPPFNLGVGRKLGSEVFLNKICELIEYQRKPGSQWKPDEITKIVLFVPMGFRLNQRRNSKRWKWLRDSKCQITSIISLPLDIFKNVEFHSEILIFNAPELKPHYWLPECFLTP